MRALATGLLLSAIAAGCAPARRPAPAFLRPIPLAELYGDAPWISVVPQLQPVEAVDGVKASDCGKCHVAHYDEWRRSTHASAYTDLQFRSELAKSSSPAWLCLNCHLPVENQREYTVAALLDGKLDQPVLTPNPGFDPAMQQEGVTCATCHVRRDEAGKSYVLGSIGGTSPPHPVRIDRAALLARCKDCHDQSYQLTPRLVCAFETGREVGAGPQADRSCPSCHLPETRRSLTVLGTPERAAHRHTFIGGPVPKRWEQYGPHLAADFVAGLELDWQLERAGSPHTIAVTLTNRAAAHRVPTGDPERFYEVEAALLDAAGRVLGRERLRLGQLWRWEPKAERLFDNRLASGQTRAWRAPLVRGVDGQEAYDAARPDRQTTALVLPPEAGAPRTIRLTLRHVRLTAENAAWMKQQASRSPAGVRDEIAQLDRHYPLSSVVYVGELDLASSARRTQRSTTLLQTGR